LRGEAIERVFSVATLRIMTALGLLLFAGVIFAAAFILYGLVFGVEAIERVFSVATLRIMTALGLLLFAGVIFAAAFILYGLVFGVEAIERVFSVATLRIMTALGLLQRSPPPETRHRGRNRHGTGHTGKTPK
jgi:multisubunit Na+/H+ antiporter MnhB subunit